MSAATPTAGTGSVLRNGVRALYTLPPFVVRHAVRSRHLDRRHVEVSTLSEAAPAHEPHPKLQSRDDGVGPVVMRTYQIDITEPVLSSSQLIRGLRIDPNHYNSNLVAGFVRANRPVRNLANGDELVVELPGPWNGPVVVQAADDTSLLLATLEGHMEAGHIRFDTIALDDGRFSGYGFRIRSWARAGDAGFAAVHLGIPIGKELQTAMWTAMCERALNISGGHKLGDITVHTEEHQTDQRHDGRSRSTDR